METLRISNSDGVARITISREKALNALNTQVLDELNVAIDEIDKDKSIRVLVITGQGEKAFVAGADIKEISDLTSETAKAFAEKGQKVFRRLEVLKCPVIAAVNGFALGGGLELALSCDFIVASENAIFGLPEVTLGLIPGFGGTQRLSRIVSPSTARRLIYTGEKLDAKKAYEIGLVTEVVPQEELFKVVDKITGKISALAPVAIAHAKEAIDRGLDHILDEALHLERDFFASLYRTKDVREGTRAFIEKRKPNFVGA